MPRRTLAFALLAGALVPPGASLLAQTPPPAPAPQPPTEKSAPEVAKEAEAPAPPRDPNDPVEKIKDEGMNRSQVMATLSHLTDVIGPRLTASPGMKHANEWTKAKLAEWGLEDAHLEAWGPFGRGWTLKRFSMQVVEPQCIPLIAFPKAWSSGTDGVLTAKVVHLAAKEEKDLDAYKGKLKGAVVLMGPARDVVAHFDALGKRLDDKQLLELADAPEPGRGQQRRPQAGRGGPNAMAEMRRQAEFARKRFQFVLDEGAALMVDSSSRGDGGTLFVQQAAVPSTGPAMPEPGVRRPSAYDKDAPKLPPQVVMANEHFNRLVRMAQQGESLTMAVDLAVEFQDGDLMGYNTVAEIPGTDLKDELVMVGGHMDSWHSGTGATDNAAGVACAMEAVRILKAANLKPRRTVRVALWSGEEQGLLGSRAYVSEHFGKRDEAPRSRGNGEGEGAGEGERTPPPLKTLPAYEKFSAYYNLDNGTGKIRGIYLQGNEFARSLFRRWLQPFRELGAATVSVSNTGGTDHQSFDAIGLPGFQFIQDPVEYDTRTHHSNQDVYDRIQADDMKQASTIIAAFLYQTATMDQKVPRKPMPGPVR